MPVIKVVEEYAQVEAFTREGWVLIETRDVERVLNLGGRSVQHPPPFGGTVGTTSWEEQREKIKTLVFVMRMDDDSALAKLNADLAAAKAFTAVAETERNLARTTAADAERRRAESERNVVLITERLGRRETEASTGRDQVRQYERVVAAIRSEIGDARMRDILDKAGLGPKKEA